MCLALERLEADGYFTEDHPTGQVNNSLLPKLCVVTIVCVATGMIVGVGFSLGAEAAEAYHMALWCCSIDKTIYCRTLGLTIKRDRWPVIVAPVDVKTDRGPGVKRAPGDFVANVDGDKQIVVRQIMESNRGKAKPNVESSHRRRTKINEPRGVKQSDLKVVAMARREVLIAMRHNKKSYVQRRMTNQMTDALIDPSPIEIFNFLEKRERIVRREISFEQATRRYLKKVDAVLTKDGVLLGHQFYGSPLLATTAMFVNVGDCRLPVTCYVLPISVVIIWAEIGDKLIEVSASQSMEESKRLIEQTYDELKLRQGNNNALRAEHERLGRESSIKTRMEIIEVNGKPPEAGTLLSYAQAKKKAKNKQDLNAEKNVFKSTKLTRGSDRAGQ